MKNKEKIKKVMLVLPEYSSFYPMMKQALDELGVQFKIFDNRSASFLEKIVFTFSKYFGLSNNLKLKLLNYRLVYECKKYRPDLVLVIKGENLSDTAILKIKERSLIVNWYPDFLERYPAAEKQIAKYSLFLHADAYEVKKYRKMGYSNFYQLPWAGMKVENSSKNRKYDVVFIGVHNKQREKMFSILADLNFKIWGSSQWGEGILSKNYSEKWVSSDETIEIIKNSKIVVNHHQNYSNKNSMLNLRVYETTGCQTLLITDYWKDLDRFYRVGKDLIVYRSRDDLYRKVKRYLKDELKRQKIAKSGYNKTRQKHTYVNRFRQLFKLIEDSQLKLSNFQ